MFRGKTFETLTQKKTKKKIWLRGIERGIEEGDKRMKKKVQIPLISFSKMIFNRSGEIKPGIENNLKTGLIDRKESKEESSQPKSFSLQNWIFWSVRK